MAPLLMSVLVTVLTSILALSPQVAQAKPCQCIRPNVRREWRTLSAELRINYIDAIKCVMQKPAKTTKDKLPNVRSRYDDFVGTHIIQADDAHFVGKFYPFHRLYLLAWEKELNTCGWPIREGLPYWDWLQDYGTNEDFFNSPIFDDVTGMGGNGAWVPGNFTNPEPGFTVNAPWDMPDRTGGGCITSGPFVDLKPSFGPAANVGGNDTLPCIRRDFSPESFRNITNRDFLESAMDQDEFGWFAMITEPNLHAGGHLGVGGLYGHMADKWGSPSDPIFWLHHGNVDRLWWSWQQRDIEKRMHDISGPLVNFDYGNAIAGNATLDDPLYIGETEKIESTIMDMMHIQRGPLCYTYDEVY